MSAPNLNYAWAAALWEQWVRSGVQHAVVCPGSRSSPLAVTAAETPGLHVWSVIDERSAGFFALGLSRATGQPAVLLATSGSAGAHFLPAVIEASMDHVPLLVATADRPWELQGFGAPQTIPQQRLFDGFALRFEELIAPEASAAAFAHVRAVAARAAHEASSAPRGPVHLNVPFREPLAPTEQAFDASVAQAPAASVRFAAPGLPDVTRLTALVRAYERGVIVCGPRAPDDAFGEAVAELGRRSGYPVIAEAASGARFAEEAVAHADLLLQSEVFAKAHAPQLVVRFGGGITSKRLQQWLDASCAPTVLVSDDGALFDPSHKAALLVQGDATAIARAAAHELQPRHTEWRQAFLDADRTARAALETALPADGALNEPAIARTVAAALPEGANLFVSSSMPIRDLDAFASSNRSALRVFCNRGANGIDGITSTALGVSAATGRPTALLTGDLAFLHDLGGLLTAKRHGLRLSIVVVNNDGGGIFSFLPIAGSTPHFEALFGTPHGLDLSHAAALFGARFHRPSTLAEVRAALGGSFESGLSVIEVGVDRQQNPAVHRALGAQVVAALDGRTP